MDTFVPGALMQSLAKSGEVVSRRSEERSAEKAQRRAWWRSVRRACVERRDVPQAQVGYDGVFILGYGLVHGALENRRGRF